MELPKNFDSLTDTEKESFIENVKFPISVKLEQSNLIKDPRDSLKNIPIPPREYEIMFQEWLKSNKDYSINDPDEDFILFLMESENSMAKVVLGYLGYK